MYKVMIVDDETEARKYFRNLVNYESLGFQIVAEASNGIEGLETGRRVKPDLVISDVVMPGMNGLEMVEGIAQFCPDCFYILLTAYNDFEYAQKAIELEVKSYILKHEADEKTLETRLRRISAQLMSRRLRNARRDWSGGFRRVDESAAPAGECAVLCAPCAEMTDAQLERLIDLRESDPNVYVLGFDEGVFAALLTLAPASEGERLRRARILESAALFSEALRGESAERPPVGVSLPFRGAEGIPAGLEQARAALAQRFFHPERAALFYLRRASDRKEEREALLREAESALKKRDFREAAQIVRTQFAGLYTELSEPALFRIDLHSLIDLLGRRGFEGTYNLAREAEKCESIDGVVRLLEEFILREESGVLPENLSAKTLEMLRYMRAHYAEDITLSGISRHLDISPIYACQVFKRDTGRTIMACLNQIRMEKAEALLRDGRYRVYEVAAMVGFHSPTYFSSKYKEFTGHAPGNTNG